MHLKLYITFMNWCVVAQPIVTAHPYIRFKSLHFRFSCFFICLFRVEFIRKIYFMLIFIFFFCLFVFPPTFHFSFAPKKKMFFKFFFAKQKFNNIKQDKLEHRIVELEAALLRLQEKVNNVSI